MKIFGKQPRDLSKEERFGLTISVSAHLAIILLAMLIYGKTAEEDRVAYIEVTMGEFQDGSPAQFAEERVEDVATRPTPTPRPVENPRPDPTPEPEVERQPQEEARPVELPEQTEEIETEEVISSPETEVIDPEVIEPEPEVQEEREPDPVQVEDEVTRTGSLLSGDRRGRTGDVNAQQGTSRDTDRSAPYILEWEGDINRRAQMNPMPNYNVDVEAIVTVRFTVNPDGSVGRIQPLRRTDPDLEAEVRRTLRAWRFNPLPGNVPQEEQSGVITFRFVLD